MFWHQAVQRVTNDGKVFRKNETVKKTNTKEVYVNPEPNLMDEWLPVSSANRFDHSEADA
jgi:hypothetical protein